MEIKWLKTFIIAAQYENFRQASEVLFLTQPAVSKHIHKIESYLHINLFVREHKTVHLSPDGRRFLPIAKLIVQQYEEGLNEFEVWKQGYFKQLTISVAPQIASSLLPKILKGFMQLRPDIEVLIHVSNSYDVLQEVANGQAEIGLTRTFFAQANLHSEAVFEEPVVLVAENDLVQKGETEILTKYRLITHNHPAYWDDLLVKIKHHYPQVQTMKVNQIGVTIKFVEEGLGVSYLPYSMVEKEVREGRLKLVSPQKIMLPMSQTYVVLKEKNEQISAFIAYFKEHLENDAKRINEERTL